MKYLLLLFPLLLGGCFEEVVQDNFSSSIIESASENCKNNKGLLKINFANGVYNSDTYKLKYTDVGITCNNGAYFGYTIKEEK
jgi:hypothetical protein